MPRTFSRLSRTCHGLAGTILVVQVTLLVPSMAAAQGGQVDQAALVKDLAGRDWLKRFDAASAILGLPADQRKPATVAAVVREIQRLQRLKGKGVEELPATVKDRNAAQTYYDNLVDIASESTDPIVIPALIAAADDGDAALGALAEFGETALPQMLAVLKRDAEPEHAQGLLYAIGLMFERQSPLKPESRASIVDVDRRYLSAGQSEVVESAIDLAVLLNEPALVSRLSTIAHARSEKDAGLSLTDPHNLSRVAGTARAALAELNGPGPMRSDEVLLEDLRSPHGRIVNDAATEILTAPSSRRTPALIAALTTALPRLKRTPDDKSGDCGYYCDLMDLAIKADDPALVPLLVKGIDAGYPVVNALAKRGDAAASALAEESQQNSDAAWLLSAQLAFRVMLERKVTLSAASRERMARVTSQQLSSRYANVVNGAIEVAGLLNDDSLRPRLKEIAEAHTMKDAKLNLIGDESGAMFTRLSTAAAKALLRVK
jgi:hypothetical protein